MTMPSAHAAPPSPLRHAELLPGLHQFEDTCHVYVVCDRDEAIAIDFGSGAWLEQAHQLGLPPIRRVYLTHHHPDQCAGLLRMEPGAFEVHAPVGEEKFYRADEVAALHEARGGMGWFPRETYHLLERGLPHDAVQHDLAAFRDHYWRDRRLRFLLTPGHGQHAISIVLDHQGKQLVFCGDAAHAGATLHQPYNLEWDHWTPTGALAACEGVKRLAGLHIDMLLPSHGPIITERPRAMLQKLTKKLDAFADAKGSVCPGEKDRYLTPHRFLASGAREIVPGLFWFHNGGYLLRSETGEALITDPHGDLAPLEALLEELPPTRITAQTATHYHGDHTSAIEQVRKRFGARLYLHPWVARMLARGGAGDVPFLMRTPIEPDERWPEQGRWTWHEYTFDIAPMPGQTWWHCGFMTTIAGKRVLFGGDTYQPASRWNGTGGFCSINGCRFREGFARTAETILQWQPHIIVNGHGTWRDFSKSYFRKAARWAARAEAATAALCPTGELERDYYLH